MDWIDEIKDRAEVATKGPWRWINEETMGHPVSVSGSSWVSPVISVYDNEGGVSYELQIDDPDREFISHSREDIPRLIAEVERLRTKLGEGEV